MKPKSIPEFEARDDIERVYHEIRQSFRVPGVNLNFRTLASFGKFLPAAWDSMRANVESAAFDDGAGRVRSAAPNLAGRMQFAAIPTEELGESRAYQIRAALELYHYVNPKLLVFTSALHLALKGERHDASTVASSEDRGTRGELDKMFAMEMEEEKPADKGLRNIFKDITKTLGLSQINSDYRTLALWPDYLESAWARLKPVCTSDEFKRASAELLELSRLQARQMPHAPGLTMERVEKLGEDPEKVLKAVARFEELLPSLILNIALLHQASPEEAVTRPAPSRPVRPREEPAWRAFQKRQKIVELGDRFVSYIDEGEGDPVVLIHGIPTWGFMWDETIRMLSKNHRVIAPDLLGFGYSDKRDCFDRSIARQTEMIDALMEELDIESAHVIAHDIGGGVALRLATLHAPRVRSLCVMNTVCYDSWPIEMMLQMGHPEMNRKFSASTIQKTLKFALKMGFHSSPDSDWMEGLLSPWRTEVGKLSLIRNSAALNTNLTTEITRLLPKISVPTLILWGEDDRFQPMKFGERLARDIPGAELERIADARHFAMIDQPAIVHANLRRFLRSERVEALPGRRSVSPAAHEVEMRPRSKRIRMEK